MGLIITPGSPISQDGVASYMTNEATTGQGLVPIEQKFRLTAVGSTISTVANFFGATSNIPLVASAEYEIEIDAWFLKTTASTVVWTFLNSAAPTSMTIEYRMSLITGISNAPVTGILCGQFYNITTASQAITTGSLTTLVNHYATFRIRLINGAGTSLKIQMTSTSGTVTPGINSYWKCRRVPASNVGAFVA